MKAKKLLTAGIVAMLCVNIPCAAAEAPKIAFSTKYGGVDFLFTDAVDRHAKAEGSSFQVDVREVGFELISAVGDAAKSVTGLQALLIDQIRIHPARALVLLGIIVEGKFHSLKFNEPATTTATQQFLESLEKAHVSILRTEGAAGVELTLSEK